MTATSPSLTQHFLLVCSDTSQPALGQAVSRFRFWKTFVCFGYAVPTTALSSSRTNRRIDLCDRQIYFYGRWLSFAMPGFRCAIVRYSIVSFKHHAWYPTSLHVDNFLPLAADEALSRPRLRFGCEMHVHKWIPSVSNVKTKMRPNAYGF